LPAIADGDAGVAVVISGDPPLEAERYERRGLGPEVAGHGGRLRPRGARIQAESGQSEQRAPLARCPQRADSCAISHRAISISRCWPPAESMLIRYLPLMTMAGVLGT